MSPKLELKNIVTRYGEMVILDGVSLSVKEGEKVAILGRSGAGKSTLFRCINALQNVSIGDAYIDNEHYISNGRLIVPAWKIRRRIGLVFQGHNLFPNFTALENVTLGLIKIHNMAKADAHEVVKELAAVMEIQNALDKYPNALSGGQSQRVALLRALVLSPDVILLDEVTSSVDPETSAQMIKAMRMLDTLKSRIHYRKGSASLSILFSTHQFHFAESFADRILFISDGKIVEDHPAGEYKKNITHKDALKHMSYTNGQTT